MEKDDNTETSKDDRHKPTNSTATSTNVTGKDIEVLETECEQLIRSPEVNQAKLMQLNFSRFHKALQ